MKASFARLDRKTVSSACRVARSLGFVMRLPSSMRCGVSIRDDGLLVGRAGCAPVAFIDLSHLLQIRRSTAGRLRPSRWIPHPA